MNNTNDLEIYSVYFDGDGYIREIMSIIDSQLDILTVHMDEVISAAIAQNSEASDVMIADTIAQVKELSRTVTPNEVSIEVGIDEGDISGSTQTLIRVLVTLHGNGTIVTKPGETTWKKDVTGPGKSGAVTVYRIPEFDQRDHTGAMMKQFTQQIKPFADDFLESVVSMIQAIDYEKYLRVG